MLLTAAKEEEIKHSAANPQAYFKPIESSAHLNPILADPSNPQFADQRVLATPSPLLPPPSALYVEQERAVLDELSYFISRAVSPSGYAPYPTLPFPYQRSSPLPTSPTPLRPSSSPIGGASASAFQRLAPM